MRSTDRPSSRSGAPALLEVRGLDVFYGQAHALQGVSLSLDTGVLAVVGRNGMGKSTLCRAITGMIPARGSITFAGRELLGLPPNEITRAGIAYVPQGRRVWRSLTVDETLRLAARTARQGAWTVDRVYQVFPRLAERRGNGGGQLSGGEQQMLAIGRALLLNPRLLVMDEPTEGLAPVIVEQVTTLLKSLADARSMAVLLIEQNLGVALELADDIAVMVNGRIAHQLPAQELAGDRALQQRLLGLRAGAAAAEDEPQQPDAEPAGTMEQRVVRAFGGSDAAPDASLAPIAYIPREDAPAIWLAGDRRAQGAQLEFIRMQLERLGARVRTADVSGGAEAFAHFMAQRRHVQGLLAVARGAAADAAWAGAQALPAAVPKLLLTDTPRAAHAGVLVMGLPPPGDGHDSEALLAQACAALSAMAAARAASRDEVARTGASAGSGVRHSLGQTS